MNSKYLILGATGSIGYAFTHTLLNEKVQATLLVRNREKAEKLFGKNDLLEIEEGDVTDLEKLKTVSKDKQFIFHGINYPYNLWEGNMEKATQNVIEAASQNKATIVFPGNIYEFGNVMEITEEMVPDPETKKGKIRLELFNMLKQAAEDGKCKVIFVRLPDFFGPNVTNGLIKPVFGNAAKKKAVNWLVSANVPHQFVFTPDAARVMYLLSKKENLPAFVNYNFSGYEVSSIKELAKTISKLTGGPAKVSVIPKWLINILALFNPIIKELKENFYQFENNVRLNDDKLKKDLPDFKPTPIEEAIRETVEWFRNNP
ncbi:MAG: NAD-dependent epimerase/dehydratase family protein [Chlorobi bacterium]|nr:NAD-dependent epimerase/dehydratase family protein [Chlorobiota bacterium]